MASISQDPKSKAYHIRFRFRGRSFKRSLKTDDPQKANLILAQTQETISLVDRGMLEIPSHCDPAKYLISGGRLQAVPAQLPKSLTLGQLFDRYQTDLPAESREPTTMGTEATHLKHFRKLLNLRMQVSEVSVEHIQKYVNARLKKKLGDRSLSPDTVRREMNTLAAIFNWCRKQKIADVHSPTRGIVYPKTNEKPPFMTVDEINQRIARGGLDSTQIDELWSCLYLTLNQVKQVMEHVRLTNPHPVMYPMFMFAAFTGARRSEILRAQLDDLDLAQGTILIREKKKSRSKSITFRRVDIPSNLVEVLSTWSGRHPGGNYLFTQDFDFNDGSNRTLPITRNQARTQFNNAVKSSDWSICRGWHLFRHSFASNLCSLGVSQFMIDRFMGHQTEEMRRRYRHLFPKDRKNAIERLA